MTDDSDNGEPRKGEPIPSRKKYYTATQLRAAVEDFCREQCRWRFGDQADRLLAGVDYKLHLEAHDQTRESEDRARKIYYAMMDAAKAARELAAEAGIAVDEEAGEYFTGRAGEYTRESFRLARAIEQESSGRLVGTGKRPSRKSWLLERVIYEFEAMQIPGEVTNNDLSALSILSGFWPTVAEPTEENGVSVAKVMRAERNAIGRARDDDRPIAVKQWKNGVISVTYTRQLPPNRRS